jgi:transcriptional regulator with XRE-family HTH domain
MNLGENVKRLRERAGMTQTDLSKRSGLDRAHISKIESGDRGASVLALIALADIFDVSLDELVGRTHVPVRHAVVTLEGVVTSVGTFDRAKAPGMELDTAEGSLTLDLPEDSVRAIATQLYRRVRLTVEVLDG